MADGGVDPARVHIREELAAALKNLLSGRSSRELQNALAKQSEADRQANADPRRRPLRVPGETAGKTTINEVLNGVRLPSPELLRALLRLSSSSVARDAGPWLEALQRVRRDTTPALAGVRVREAQPRLLGVHRAIHVDGAEGYLPDYVPRDTDTAARGVRGLISAAAEHGGLVLLVWVSSVGKTRCAYQAITELLPDWQLVHPAARSDQLARLATSPVPKTVVWLDELQNYLGDRDGLTVDVVRALLSAPVPIVLVATLWPGRYSTYTTPPKDGGRDDPYRSEREVLAVAEVVRLDPVWSDAEMARARQAAPGDRRIEYAVSAGGRFSLPQILAAAPQLAERWDNADPYATAVLAAAVDATRLGYRSPLRADLLRAAAVGYCDSRTQATAPENWFETAIAYATEPLHGAASALEPVAASMGKILGYTVADYLLQCATPKRHRQRIPHHTWDALLIHTHDPTDASRIGQAATNRLLYCYALPLLQRSADAANPWAAHQLAELLADRNDIDALRERADAGEPAAAIKLAELLEERGNPEAAITLLRGQADAGNVNALSRLARLLVERGDTDTAISVLRRQPLAADQLVLLLKEQGDIDALRERAHAGDSLAAYGLVELLAEQGDFDALRELADAGDSEAAFRLAPPDDIDAMREFADAGNPLAIFRLADLLIQQGDIDALRELADADAGGWAAFKLAPVLARQGDIDSLHKRSDAGDISAAHALVWMLAQRGDIDALRERADAGNRDANYQLARLFAEQNAEPLLLNEVRVGNSKDAAAAWFGLLESSDNPADQDRAQHARWFGLTPPPLADFDQSIVQDDLGA